MKKAGALSRPGPFLVPGFIRVRSGSAIRIRADGDHLPGRRLHRPAPEIGRIVDVEKWITHCMWFRTFRPVKNNCSPNRSLMAMSLTICISRFQVGSPRSTPAPPLAAWPLSMPRIAHGKQRNRRGVSKLVQACAAVRRIAVGADIGGNGCDGLKRIACSARRRDGCRRYEDRVRIRAERAAIRLPELFAVVVAISLADIDRQRRTAASREDRSECPTAQQRDP